VIGEQGIKTNSGEQISDVLEERGRTFSKFGFFL